MGWPVLVSLLFVSAISDKSLAFADDNIAFYDFSWITKWAAIGDSYAAGIGAGNVLQSSCSRYDGAYPNLINLQLGIDPQDVDFTFGACSGALTTDIISQANKLSSGQQMITISSGGNDVGLSKVLNNCVFTWWTTQSCGETLDEAQTAMENDNFANNIDTLLSTAKSKLTDNGTIYYTGYAKFFDTSTNDCDTVTWAVWARKASWQYLTQFYRRRMNDLVDMMNSKLQAAVDRAGGQVVFVNYDSYLDIIDGRFCMPGVDESAGKGSQREYLFFYEMKTTDSALLEPGQAPPKTELRRRTTGTPANDTLGAIISAWVEDMLQTYPDTVLEDENANSDLEEQVSEGKQELRRRLKAREAPNSPTGPSRSISRYRGWNDTSGLNFSTTGAVRSTGTGISLYANSTSNATIVNSTVVNLTHNSTIFNSTTLNSTTFNSTFLNSTSWSSKSKAVGFFIPDSVSRVFHPQQGGHYLIANLVMWHMAVQQNVSAKAPEISTLSSPGDTCIMAPSPVCNGSSTDTWITRDSAASAISSFCSMGLNLNGTAGQTTSKTYNNGTLNLIELSINWKDTDTMDDGSCNTYFLTLLDSCDIPGAGSANLKHGGSIDYQGNATVNINPLIMQREWDGGQPTYHICNGVSTDHYLEQSILASNVQDYCTKLAQNTIAPNGYEFSQDYQAGTPDTVTISTSWPTGNLDYQIFENECYYYLSTIMNGCDVPSGGTNPMNWKHGGQMSDNNRVTYTIKPTTLRPSAPDSPQAECTFKVRTSKGYDDFSVSGGGFANSDNGGELRKQLSGCGLLSGWKFDYFMTPVGSYEWTASGSVPEGMKPGCIERAVHSAGGPATKDLHCS